MHGAGYTQPPEPERRARSLDAIQTAVQRNLPTPYDHRRIAEALLDGKPVDQDTVRAMQTALIGRAQNPRGINEDELQSRRSVNARPGSAADYRVNQPASFVGTVDRTGESCFNKV
jgi:hypothetical protein